MKKSTDLPLPEQRRRLAIMEEFFNHDGWKLIRETIEREVTIAAMQMGDDPRQPSDVIHFQRGMIRAAKEFLGMQERMLFKMRSDIQIEESVTNPTSPAKAGRKETT